MTVLFPTCSFKCDKEAGCSICQNSSLANEPDIEISPIEIVTRYVKNPITKAIVFGGLEPLDSWKNGRDLMRLIAEFRHFTQDDIIIYTGYTEEEIPNQLAYLRTYRNIIVKFGRFIPNQEKHYDEVLGVELASPNQYARRIS